MRMDQKEFESFLERMIEKSIKKYMDDFLLNLPMEIINENGNSSIKQSGNSIVYVDNTGIAYVLLLFHQFFMKDHLDEKEYKNLLNKIEKMMEENRKTFKKAIEKWNKR